MASVIDIDALVECAIVKRNDPTADLVSRKAIGEEFGQSWVTKKEDLGLLNGSDKDGEECFSRLQAMTLRVAERICSNN